MNLTLIRTKTSDQATIGQIQLPNGVILHTAELPWRDNDPNTSSIIAATYPVKWMWSPHHNAYKYQLQNTGNRTYVEIHSGNFSGDVTLKDSDGNQLYQSDVLGCILLGKSVGLLKNKFGNMQEGVEDSKSAVQEFETFMNGQDFTLTITML